MPGYGLHEGRSGLLPWSWAVELLNRTRNHVVSTVCPDGRPHAMPVWGLWWDGVYGFSTAISSVKSNNLKKQPRCVVTATDGDDAVILEGTAELVDPPPGFAAASREKYGEGFPEGPSWIVRPSTVIQTGVPASSCRR